MILTLNWIVNNKYDLINTILTLKCFSFRGLRGTWPNLE